MKEDFLDNKTIHEAVSGDQQAIEKVLSYYADLIDLYSTVETRSKDGGTKRYVDPDLRQHIVMKLLEALPTFPVE